MRFERTIERPIELAWELVSGVRDLKYEKVPKYADPVCLNKSIQVPFVVFRNERFFDFKYDLNH